MNDRPTLAVPSAVAAVVTGSLVAGVVAVAAGALVPFAGELVGLALFAVGRVAHERRRIVRVVARGVGVAVALGSAAVAVEAATDLNGLAVLPGVGGVFVLAIGLAARRRPRGAVAGGAGGLLLSVLVAGALGTVSTVGLLLAGAGTVLAWDLGQQAVDLGDWGTPSLRTEAIHAGGTTLVGVLGVAVAVGSSAIGAGDASLSAVIAALLGSVGLAALLGK